MIQEFLLQAINEAVKPDRSLHYVIAYMQACQVFAR